MRYQEETQGLSRNQTAVAAAMLFVGDIIPTPANIEAALRGDPFAIGLRQDYHRAGNPNSEEWRDKDAWHLYAADMMRVIRAIKAQPLSPDARWLAAMVDLWRLAFTGTSEHRHFQWAKSLARDIGELKYWRQKIKPVMLLSAGLYRNGQSMNLAQMILAGFLPISGPPELPGISSA